MSGQEGPCEGCRALPRSEARAEKKKKRYPQTKVTVTLLPGASAQVEIPALPLPGGQLLVGTPVTREVPLSGGASGVLAHRFRPGQDIDIDFRSLKFRPGAVDLLSDPACGGAPALRINPASAVVLDGTRPSTSVLRSSGVSKVTAHVLLRLAFDMRTEARCDAPLVTTGYAETPFTDRLTGTIGPRGLVALGLDGAPTALSYGVCLYPGAPDKPCSGEVARYPVKITVRATVSIRLKLGK